MSRKIGAYIAFEGIDTAGKSTQAELLAKRLDAVHTFEPGATELGKLIRPLLLQNDTKVPTEALSEGAEALLFGADRAQHLATVVAPALLAGRHVVTDRSFGSTLAYQGYGRQVAIDRTWELVLWASRLDNRDLAAAARADGRFGWPAFVPAPFSQARLDESGGASDDSSDDASAATDEVFLLPDVVILLDVSFSELSEITERAPSEPDRFESEPRDFLRRMSDGYRALASQDDRRWVSVNALGTPAEVEQRVFKALEANPVFEMLVSNTRTAS